MTPLAVLGLLLGYFLPGYLASFLIFGKRFGGAERLLFSAAFSIALVGALMNLLGMSVGFSKESTLAIMLAFCAIVFAVKKNDVLSYKPEIRLPAMGLPEKAILAFALVQIVFTFYYAIFFPIDGGDAVSYHAPYAKLFYERGTIYDAEGFLEQRNAFPHGMHLFGTWFYLLNDGVDDLFARLVAPVSAVLLALTAYLFAKNLFGVRAGFLAVLAFFSMPLVIAHASSAYINLPEAFFGAVAMYALYRGVESSSQRMFFAAGLIAGFVPLVKQSGIAFLLIAALLIVVFRRDAKSLLAFAAGALLLGFPLWYVRNLLVFGNAFYPFSFFGQGSSSDASAQDVLPSLILDRQVTINYGVGPMLVSFGIAGLLLMRGMRGGKFVMAWLLSLIALVTLLLRDVRYALLAAAPVSVAAALGMRELLQGTALRKKAIALLIVLVAAPALMLGVLSFKTATVLQDGNAISIGFYFPPPSHRQFLETMYGSDTMAAFDYLNGKTPADSKVLSPHALTYFINRTLYVSGHLPKFSGVDEALRYAKSRGIGYVLLPRINYAGATASDTLIVNANDTRYFEPVFRQGDAVIYRIR
jgi:hypothetical protein